MLLLQLSGLVVNSVAIILNGTDVLPVTVTGGGGVQKIIYLDGPLKSEGAPHLFLLNRENSVDPGEGRMLDRGQPQH